MRFIFFIAFIFISSKIFASTIIVGKNGNYKTIHAALQKINVGDVVIVDGGVYAEGEIRILKSIKFIGRNHPILMENTIAR
jgi:hypothetical protein